MTVIICYSFSKKCFIIIENYTGLESRCGAILFFAIQALALSYGVFQLVAVPGFALILWRCPEASRTSTACSLRESFRWAICSALLLYYSEAQSLECLRINLSQSGSQLFTPKLLHLMIISLSGLRGPSKCLGPLCT